MNADPEKAEALQVARKDRLSDKREMSGRIGETSRYIAFGLIALVLAVHGSNSPFLVEIREAYPVLLNLCGLAGCFAILADYLQYLCGYFSANHAISRQSEGYTYNRRTFAYQGRQVFFWLKQVLAFVGSLAIVAMIAHALLTA